ncbi:hypothetical protein CDL15_Pgr002480 [Punica granatum]|uniref:Uncharacterized protein n=1 Tax=Punica granatum TaxID=22663 RepID=A0A218XUS4_PUNGR|nr:hypothetical protein CDL15_Pgr002480 [Punica granatum]
MGGGGVIRAVGKVAGIGAAASRGFRGANPAPVAEHPARGASRNVAAIVSSKSGVVSAGDVSPVAVQKPAWEMDDWELAGGEGDLVMSSGEPMPRVVFGAAPSFQEAKAATDELKDALDKVYLSSPAANESGISIPLGHPSDQPLQSDSEVESKHLVSSESAVAPPAPKHVVQAFRMLTQSPAAQNVVASIASDLNVWNAVLQNEALVDFVQTQKATVQFPSEEPNMESLVEHVASQGGISTKSLDESNSESESGNSRNGFRSFLQNMKHAVEDMVSEVSDFFQNIFGPKAEDKASTAGSGDGGSTFMEAAPGAYFVGLAVLAILVVLLKRA